MEILNFVNVLGEGMDILVSGIATFFITGFVSLILITIIYVLTGIFINKLYQLKNNKKTSLGFIPFVRIYTLFKLIYNSSFISILLMIAAFPCLFFSWSISLNIISLISQEDLSMSFDLYTLLSNIFLIITFILGAIKYSSLEKDNLTNNSVSLESTNTQIQEQPAQPQPVNQPQNIVQPAQPQPVSQPQNLVQPVQSQPVSQPQNLVQPVQSQPMDHPQNNNINMQ